MLEKIIKYVSVDKLPLSTPGKPGGVIAIIVGGLGREPPMTAAQYGSQNFMAIHALDLWKEVRFIHPADLHPDDYRTLYPADKGLNDERIKELLNDAQTRLLGDKSQPDR